MQVFHTFRYLLKYSSARRLRDTPLRIDIFAVIVQRYSINILCHYVYLFGRVYQLKHLDDVRMIDAF